MTDIKRILFPKLLAPKLLAITSCLLVLSACSKVPPEAYANRGDPESMLSVSSEVVNVNLTSPNSLHELSDRITQDTPTRAILNCSQNDALCSRATTILSKYKIDVQRTGSGNNISLIYEQVIARDCENRYIDNSSNMNNLNMPTFGCSLRSNTVQMVTDKRQFTNPGLLDLPDGEKALQTYDSYLKPAVTTAAGGVTSSLVQGGVSQL